MTSPFRPGFLYDPGISHFSRQTRLSSAARTSPELGPRGGTFPVSTPASPAQCACLRGTLVPSSARPPRHHVRGAAVRRGEDERLRGGQRRQPDVLQLRAAGHQLLLRGVAGEETPQTRTDRQGEASCHRRRPNRRGAEGDDGQSVTRRVKEHRAMPSADILILSPI